jgi:hypothetical protein
MRILPSTPIGRVGLLLAGIGVAAYAILLTVHESMGGFEHVARLLGLGLPILAMVVGAVLAAIAVIRRGDRGILAFAAMVPGGFFLLLLVAEAVGLME